ncbi:MAG: DUF11 domain-containing protein [Gammaproteobacteria bacterium]|nr:DUF11 domain-containing protein [Gammaproteobacteria bacterium]
MTHITLMFALFAVFTAQAAQAQVRLDNTIKKVQTFVNESGEVQRRMVDADSVIPGDELQYTIRFTNHGEQTVDAGTIVITDAIPSHTEYLDGTAFGSGTQISFSVDGEGFAAPAQLLVLNEGDEGLASAQQYTGIRWAFSPMLAPGESGYVSFNVRLK